MVGGWQKLDSKEQHNLCSLSSIIRTTKLRKMGWGVHVARMGRKETHRILLGRPEGKKPLRKPRRYWKNNTKRIVEMGRCSMDWIALDQDRDHWRTLVCTILNLRIP
jgi:hypothetical protein